MDQILLKEKYEIFPHEKRLEIRQYKKISSNLDKLSYMNSRTQASQIIAEALKPPTIDWETIQP
jgi:hypothetical protein